MSINLPRIASIFFWILIGLATYLLLMEQEPSPPKFPHADKVIHASLFAILSALGYLAYAQHRIWLFLGLISYGLITEVLQSEYTLTRNASFHDWMADVAGVLLCFLIMNKLKQYSLGRYVR